jgi:hypothetical protein
MKKVLRLTESELINLIKKVINENDIENVGEPEVDNSICETGINYESFYPTFKIVIINLPGNNIQEREELYNKIKNLNCDIKLNNIITNEVFTINSKDIRLTNSEKKNLYIFNDVYEKKIFPYLTKIEQFERFIDSTPIKKALELAFPNNWKIKTTTHVAGVVGVLPIKTAKNKWSIVNFFNTKQSVIRKIKMFLVRDYKYGTFNPDLNDIKGSVINWMANLFSNINSSDMTELVKIQEKSINDAYSQEVIDSEKIRNVLHPGKTFKISGFGTIKDINLGIDVTIGGVTYQIKPCSQIKPEGDIIKVSIGGSNPNDYTKNPVKRIAFFKGEDMYVFNNNAISLNGNTYSFNKSDLIYPR